LVGVTWKAVGRFPQLPAVSVPAVPIAVSASAHVALAREGPEVPPLPEPLPLPPPSEPEPPPFEDDEQATGRSVNAVRATASAVRSIEVSVLIEVYGVNARERSDATAGAI
jgi:hypothetical protein